MIRILGLFLVLPWFAASVGFAADVSWSGLGADSEWLNAANWSSNPVLPAEGVGTAGDTLFFDTTANHAVFDVAAGSRTYRQIRVGANTDGRLDVTGGTLTGDHTITHWVGRNGNAGTVNITGNGILRIGHIAEIGQDNGSIGTVNVSNDGAYWIFRGGSKDGQGDVSISLGAGGTGEGTLNLNGGSVRTRFGVMLGQNSLAGSGRFHVNGGDGSAVIGGHSNVTSNGFWLQRGNGTLAATVDSAGFSLGTIDIHDAGASYVRFDAGAILDLGFSGMPPASTMSWNLMTFKEGALTDNGLTLAAGDAAAGWSFAFVDTNTTPGADTLRITFTTSGGVPTVAVGSIAELRSAASLTGYQITMTPGTYWLTGPASRPAPTPDYPIFLDLSGSSSTFDFTGVEIKVDTRELRGYGRVNGHADSVRVFQISGSDITVDGLTLTMENVAFNGTDSYGDVKEYTADWSTTLVEIIGSGTVLKNSNFTTRGSYPYGYGDAFGKGGRPADGNGVTNAAWIDHRKQSGIRIGRGATDITLDNIDLNMRTFGHGIFMQEGASDILIKNSVVLGDSVASSNAVIAHPQYQQWGFATYGVPIPPDLHISKHEDAIRVYTNDNFAINGWPQYIDNLTVEGCRIERMRDALATGEMTGWLRVADSEAYGCEQAFTPSALAMENTFTACKGDAVNGPLLFFRRSADNVTASVELAGTAPPQGTWPIALISGNGHQITLTRTAPAGLYPVGAHVGISQGWREWRHRPNGDIDASSTGNVTEATTGSTIINLTGQPLVFGPAASGNTASSNGGVINKGLNNTYTGTTLVSEPIIVQDIWSSPPAALDVPWAHFTPAGVQDLPTPPYTVFSGVQTVSNSLSLGGTNETDAGTEVSAGGCLNIAAGLAVQGEHLAISGSGAAGTGALFSEGALSNATRFATSGGSISLVGDATIGVGTAGNQFLIGPVGGTGDLTTTGPGVLVMEGGGNSFDGSLTVAQGELQVRANKARNDLTIASGAIFSQTNSPGLNQEPTHTTIIDGTLNLNRRGIADANAHSANVGRLLGGPAGLITSTSAAAVQTLNVTGNGADSVYSGAIEGRVTLVKTGSAKLVLDGSCTHTEPTIVNEGVLELNGSIGAGSPVILNDGATLTGAGPANGGVVVNGGATFSPGGSVGGFAASEMTLAAGGALEVEINDPSGIAGGPNGWDLITLSGALAIDAGVTASAPFLIRLIGQASGGNPGVVPNFDRRRSDSWRIISANTVTGTFATDQFEIDASGFAANNPLDGGVFALTLQDDGLVLGFTPSPYAAWKFEKGMQADVAPDADPDGNGVPVLVEYALAIDPGAPGGLPEVARGTGGAWEFTFNRARPELFYDVEVSPDLTEWAVHQSNPGEPGAMVAVSYTPAAPGDRCFFRLRVRRE